VYRDDSTSHVIYDRVKPGFRQLTTACWWSAASPPSRGKRTLTST